MTPHLPQIYLVRHGETAWTVTGQHTGRTDLPLTPRGRENAQRLTQHLRGRSFAWVLCSPLQRARQTCALAGFGDRAVIDDDLVEWDYGAYEGLTSDQIAAQRPGWELFRDGCPGGESVADITARADHALARIRSLPAGDGILFSSSHFLRILAARWLGLEPGVARHFFLGTAALSILGCDHGPADPVIRLWNDTFCE